MRNGFFVSIEGGDKCGKETQTKKLAKTLSNKGYKVATYSFPNYESETGKLIKEVLSGNSFNKNENPILFQGLMTLNRYELMEEMLSKLEEGFIVITDRFTASGWVYGTMEGVTRKWLKRANFGLLKPDLTLILDISETEYSNRCNNYDYLDINERDLEFMTQVRKAYRDLAEENGWILVRGEGSVESVAKKILKIVTIGMES